LSLQPAIHLQCFLVFTAVDVGLDSQLLLYVWNIAVMPVAKVQQAWNYFCWKSLYSIKLLHHSNTSLWV